MMYFDVRIWRQGGEIERFYPWKAADADDAIRTAFKYAKKYTDRPPPRLNMSSATPVPEIS